MLTHASSVLSLLLMVGCATSSPSNLPEQTLGIVRGPWPEVPAVEMPTGDTSIPIGLIRDVAEALLKRPGAKVCEPSTQRPIEGLSTEYCATVYVAGSRDSLSWRVTEPIKGTHQSCETGFAVRDDDYTSSQVWVVGYVHNHPCGAPPSASDLSVWPTDAFKPYVAMAEMRLIPGNPAPAVHGKTAIEMASALVAERQDGSRIFLRYFPTGEIQQWSQRKSDWVTLDFCSPPEASRFGRTPQCRHGALRLLRE